jgi:hypothetical protein
MLGRRQYPKEHMAEAKRFKDTEKIPHIEGNEFANTFSGSNPGCPIFITRWGTLAAQHTFCLLQPKRRLNSYKVSMMVFLKIFSTHQEAKEARYLFTAHSLEPYRKV